MIGSSKTVKRNVRFYKMLAASLLIIFFVGLSLAFLEWEVLMNSLSKLIKNPLLLVILTFFYGLAFWLRAWAWKLYVGNRLSFQTAVQGVFYSLFINHVSPVKLGDGVRIAIASKEETLSIDEAAHSVIAMRVLDFIILIGIAFLGSALWAGFAIGGGNQAGAGVALIGIGIVMILLLVIFFRHHSIVEKHINLLKHAFQERGMVLLFLVVISWMCEAVAVYGIAIELGVDLSFWQALWVNSLTVSGGIFQVTPGGIATYESIMIFALTALGIPGQLAYSVAIITHGFKFLFSYAVGFYLIMKLPEFWQTEIVKNQLKKRGDSE